MLVTLAVVALLAAQPAAEVRSPYLDAVRRYGPGTEGKALVALQALHLRDADQVFDELDERICASVGARGCRPKELVEAGRESQKKVAATWRRLYPRALALHVEALAACHPADLAATRLHLTVLLRMLDRIDEVAREHRDVPPSFAEVATLGRHLVLWTMQYLRQVDGLDAAVQTFEARKIVDVDLRLARGALEELRATPDGVEHSLRGRALSDSIPRDVLLAREERRLLEVAATSYEALLSEHPAVLEGHLRLSQLLLRLGRADEAGVHLLRVAGLGPDARQAYLAALFLADVYERRGRTADALAAYETAQQRWPGAQTPGIGIARLRAMNGSHQEARAALAGVHLEQPADAPPRLDPWMGYIGAQSWRLPTGVLALQARFEAEP
jgi:tetratricopeptide (TPR) repeat protein